MVVGDEAIPSTRRDEMWVGPNPPNKPTARRRASCRPVAHIARPKVLRIAPKRILLKRVSSGQAAARRSTTGAGYLGTPMMARA